MNKEGYNYYIYLYYLIFWLDRQNSKISNIVQINIDSLHSAVFACTLCSHSEYAAITLPLTTCNFQ